jgi:uncharacterized protein (DUF4415 family)
MTVKKSVSSPSLKSRLAAIDSHVIQAEEYEDLPELTDEAFARGVINKGGRPKLANPKQLITLRLAPEIIEKWKATGPGWQTRMASKLARVSVPRS